MIGQSQDLATNYTLEFIRRSLPAQIGRLLEIGCGSGELASGLVAEGLEIVAIDADADVVAAARERGVDARLAEWPDFDDGTFDAILFTRSLHHVRDLDGSIAAAFAVLRGNGRIVVEDFRAEGAGGRSESWFRSLATMLNGSNLLADLTPYLREILGKAAPHDHDADHQLHSSSSIARALGSAVQAENSAYYFRYLLPAIADGALGPALLEHELELISAGLIDPLGCRYVVERLET